MAGAIPLIPRQQYSDANGDPLAGGFVNVYLAGTTARTNTWQDRAQTVLNTNPVALDASGSCSIYVDDPLLYKFVVTDAQGVIQPHIGGDNILASGPLEATVTVLAVDRFSGDGATTAFTLSTTPSGENNTSVYVDGVYQQKNTYGLVADSLVFSVAPAAGSGNIEVCTIGLLDYASVQAAIIQAAGAAETVAHIYPGVFATAPTTRPDGSAILDGDRYINSADGFEYIRVGGVWTNAANSATAAAVSAAAAAASAAAAAATVTAVTEHSQSFTAAAGTTWTLTGDVTTITKVFVNGVYFRLNNFSIVGKVVSYTGAMVLPSTSLIDICYVI